MPSAVHEGRRELLGTLAVLVGCTMELQALPDGLVPDVLRADPSRRRLFVGDAKATETAGTSETVKRLGRYAAWVATQKSAVLAVCHGPVDVDSAWLDLLSKVVRSQGGAAERGQTAFIDGDDWLSWIEVRHPSSW